MIVTYMTDDNVLVSVCHVGAHPDGQAKWQARVEAKQGIAQWVAENLPAPPAWSAQRVARHALEYAQASKTEGCPCPDPDCPGKGLTSGVQVFGPTDPHAVKMRGPWFDREDAIEAVLVASGMLDDDDIDDDEPTVAELVAELDGTPPPRDDPPDPHKGSTWKLG